MFRKRCTLCGGKLDSRNICTECGLNNNQSEKHYKINQNTCDGSPLTHVHGDRENQWNIPGQDGAEKKWQKEKERKPISEWQNEKKDTSYSYRMPEQKTKSKKDKQRKKTMSDYGSPKKGKWAGKVVKVFVVLSVLGAVIEGISEIGINNILSDIGIGNSYEEESPYLTIEENGYELPEEGEFEQFELPSGNYIVGVNLPSGIYSADMQNAYDVIQVTDYENSIYLYEYLGKEETNYLGDIRLFNGAMVKISAEDTVTLTTENAQDTEWEENPLTEVYELAGNVQKKSGSDFEPGVYDFCAVQGSGTIKITVYNEDGEEFRNRSIYIGEGSTDGIEYRNVVLPKDAKISITDDKIEDTLKVNMIPSEKIPSTDYMQIYRDYDY